jgi:hypothetical protein
MVNAPERIWAFYAPEIADDNNGATIVAYETVQHGGQPYRRADLPRPEDAARIAALEEANARLREALAFYADEGGDGYDACPTNYGLSMEVGKIIKDCGQIARAALEAPE